MEYGRYRILNQLGQGGMATVYLAEDPLLNRLVAIKVIQAHLSSNSSLMDRFTVEAKTIASLRHINIVEVFDFGAQDDQQYLVMEYIDGQNLQAICAAQGGKQMPNTVAAAIICQAAEGLTSAEKHGVVHRDIKPENLMFNSEGTLKIADFGIAHIADEQSRTQTGAVLGSPNFMSPEQIEGLRPTNQTDLFSLGGVAYYCLTGKLPFTGPSIPVTMRNICERPAPSILELNPNADPVLIQLTDTLLQKLPENRGGGARWLANQLRAYLNSKDVVDIVDHAKTYIAGLGISGGGRTIMEGPSTASGSMKAMRAGTGSSVAGFPASAIIKTGATMAGSKTLSKAMASSVDFQTQATTGAMGPSSRSPVVWIGGLLSLCVLVLAGAVIWTRLDHGDKPSTQVNLPETQVAMAPVPKTPPAPTVGNSSTGNTLPSTAPGDNPGATPTPPPPTHIETEKPPKGNDLHISQMPRKGPSTHSGESHSSLQNSTSEGSSEATGFVLIKSAPPFAALTINGKPQGETPMNAFLEVPIGKCHVEIVHRLSPPFDTIINITAGFRREFKFKLER